MLKLTSLNFKLINSLMLNLLNMYKILYCISYWFITLIYENNIFSTFNKFIDVEFLYKLMLAYFHTF